MMHEMEPGNHPTDEELAGWVDARIGRDGDLSESAPPVTAHLADCDRCRARVAALEDVIAVLRAEPPAPDPAALAEWKARVLERVGGTAAAPDRRARWWWIPAAAAAALVGLFVARGGELERPAAITDRAGAATPLAVVAAADRAAAEVAAAIEASDTIGAEIPTPVEVPPADLEISEADFAVLDLGSAPMPGAAIVDAELAEEFGALPAEDQQAILTELQAVEFEL
jgi:anti-sigma factor RsiW